MVKNMKKRNVLNCNAILFWGTGGGCCHTRYPGGGHTNKVTQKWKKKSDFHSRRFTLNKLGLAKGIRGGGIQEKGPTHFPDLWVAGKPVWNQSILVVRL